MEAKSDVECLTDCRIAWMTVERDFSAKLHTPESLKHALQCSGRNPSEKLINHYWSKCGGSISFDQFTEIMQKEKRTTMADLMKAFRRIDLNGDGFISHDELFKVLTKKGEKLTHEEVQAIIDEADYNKDGKLDYAEFCHILLSTAAECQAASKKNLSKALSRTSNFDDSNTIRTGKKKEAVSKPFASAEDSSMHHEGRSSLARVKDKSMTSKVATVTGTEGNRPYQVTPATEIRQSLLSKAERNSSLRSGSADRETQSRNNNSSTKHSASGISNRDDQLTRLEQFVVSEGNVSAAPTVDSKPVSKSSEVSQNGTILPEDKVKVKESVGVKVENKPVKPDSESEKEVEEDLDESSNFGDSILQQLPMSSTPAPTKVGVQSIVTEETGKQNSQLFASKLPAISKPTLPPLTLPQTITKPSANSSISAHLTSDHVKTSVGTAAVAIVTAPSDLVATTSSTPTSTITTTDITSTMSAADAATITSAIVTSKSVLEDVTDSSVAVKPLPPDVNVNPAADPAADGSVRSKGDGMGEPRIEKESSHDELVTVTPLSHTLSSELSGTLTDDSVLVTPTESIDVSDSDTDAEKSVQGLLANEQQPDHLKQHQQQGREQAAPPEQLGSKAKKQPPSSAVYQKPPKIPSDLESWYTISGKGCFYIKRIKDSHISDEQVYNIVSQRYGLNLPQSTCVFAEIQVVEPGDELFDVALFIFKSDSTAEAPTDFVTFTEHQINNKFVCKLDLDAGNYILVPFTSGCRLKPREDDSELGDPVKLLSSDSSELTSHCVEVLTEIFHRIDLDDNGFISRQEFDLFQEHTSGEVCDDDAWQVIQENFDQNSDDEITLKGFLDLHLMTAQDTSGGKEIELMNVLRAMGYNNQLKLDEACPFSLDVHTDSCEGEIVVMELQPFSSLINLVLCRLAIMRGVPSPVKGVENDELVMLYIYDSLYHTSIAIENKKERKISVQLDCSSSHNFLYNRESCVQVLEVSPNDSVLGFHLMPENPKEEWKPVCHAELILTQ